MGLGAALTAFEAYIQDYLSGRGPEFQPLNAKGKTRPGRMVALVGDAELDEGARRPAHRQVGRRAGCAHGRRRPPRRAEACAGNVFEALLERWKHNMRNNWWIIDYNRQSLDKVLRMSVPRMECVCHRVYACWRLGPPTMRADPPDCR